MIERVLYRIDEHVEEWRKQDAARKKEAASHREELWAEAVADGETPPASLEEMTEQHREDLTEHWRPSPARRIAR